MEQDTGEFVALEAGFSEAQKRYRELEATNETLRTQLASCQAALHNYGHGLPQIFWTECNFHSCLTTAKLLYGDV